MLKPIGVRLNLSYVNECGVPIKEHEYPTYIHLDNIYFAEDVNSVVVGRILDQVFSEVDLPDDVRIRWKAVDAFDDLRGHLATV